MLDYVKKLERWLTMVLVGMMTIVVILSVVSLGWELARDITSPPFALLAVDELLTVFGSFLLVLIGIELLETITAYAAEHEVRAEIILIVAIIALARKIITVDLKALTPGSLLGLAALIAALGVTHHLIKRGRKGAPPTTRV
jgi:uncharacterized membrane protein (DUF373 family)